MASTDLIKQQQQLDSNSYRSLFANQRNTFFSGAKSAVSIAPKVDFSADKSYRHDALGALTFRANGMPAHEMPRYSFGG